MSRAVVAIATVCAATGLGAAGLSAGSRAGPPPPPPGPRFAVGEKQLTFVDRSRKISLPGQPPGPRTLTTVIRTKPRGPPAGRRA